MKETERHKDAVLLRATVTSRAMRFQMLSFLVILSYLYLTMAQGSYDDCCLDYSKPIPQKYRNRVVKYRIQEPEGGCSKPAVVFTLKKGRFICADPKQEWVPTLIKRVDKMKTYSITKKHHHQGPKRG
ncbi:unnamed protein product [Gadus morhua 'NCC']